MVRPGRKGEQPFLALEGCWLLLALHRLTEESRLIAADRGVTMEMARDKALEAAAIVVSKPSARECTSRREAEQAAEADDVSTEARPGAAVDGEEVFAEAPEVDRGPGVRAGVIRL